MLNVTKLRGHVQGTEYKYFSKNMGKIAQKINNN